MPVKNAFLAGVLAHVPEADRGKAEAELIALEEGGLRQDDYSKKVADARASQERFDTLYAKNTEWFADKQAALVEADTLRARVAELEAAPPVKAGDPPPQKDLVTRSELTKLFDEFERGAVGYGVDLVGVSNRHQAIFGTPLDRETISKIVTDPRAPKLTVMGVYNEMFKEQLDAKAKAASDAAAEALRTEGYNKARAELANTSHPYPVVGNEPSALDAIEAARAGKAPTVKSLDDMAAEYARLSTTRHGAPA